MGVYGYGTAGIPIPEGYLEVKIEVEDGSEIREEILYPTNPGSIYHPDENSGSITLCLLQ